MDTNILGPTDASPVKTRLRKLLAFVMWIAIAAAVLAGLLFALRPQIAGAVTEVHPLKLFLMLQEGEDPQATIYNGQPCFVYQGFDGQQYANFVSRQDRSFLATCSPDVPQYVVLWVEGVPRWAAHLGVEPTPMEEWRADWYLHASTHD